MTQHIALSPNFAFLAAYDRYLALLPTYAEAYFHQDRNTCMVKVRQFGEALAAELRVRQQLEIVERETQEQLLARLQSHGMLPAEVAAAFHTVRRIGNNAIHAFVDGEPEAVQCLRTAHYLAVWFHKTMCGGDAHTTKYRLPPRPGDPSAELERRLSEMQSALCAAEHDANAAVNDRDKARAQYEELERRLKAERERYAGWLRDLESRLSSLTAADAEALALAGRIAARSLVAPANYDRPGVWVEQKSHLEHFVGRAHEMTKIREWIEKTDNGYLLVLGGPGLGKSALMAKLAASRTLGVAVGTQELPSRPVLLYMGKSGADQRQILQFLLWQASGFLDEPLGPSEFTGSVSDLRDRLQGALAGMVSARGCVTLVFDALDEIVNDLKQPAHDLLFLPDTMPAGVTVLLSIRPSEGIVTHLQRRLTNVQTLSLPPLSEDDIAGFFWDRLDPPVFDALRAEIGFDCLRERTGGIPLLLRRVADVARRSLGADSSHGSAWIPDSLEQVFVDQYRDICQPPGLRRVRGEKLRETIASLLALSTEPIGVPELVSSCFALGIPATTSGVRQCLEQMRAFLVDLGGGFRLYHHGLADFIEDRLGSDGRLVLHRALSGDPITDSGEAAARLQFHVAHALAWHMEACRLRRGSECAKAAEAVARTLTTLSAVAGAVEAGLLHDLVDLLERVWEQCQGDLDDSARTSLAAYRSFLNEELATLAERPWLLYQQALRSSSAIVRAAAEDVPAPDRPYFRAIQHDPPRVDAAFVRAYPDSDGVWSARLDAVQVAANADVVVALRDDNEAIGAWRIRTGEPLWHRRFGLSLNEDRIAVSRNGRYVALSQATKQFPYNDDGEEIEGADPIGNHGGFTLLDGRDGTDVAELYPQLEGTVKALAFSCDERFLFVGTGGDAAEDDGDADGAIYKYSIDENRIVARVEGLQPVRALAVSESGSVLISGGGWSARGGHRPAGTVMSLEAATLQELNRTAFESRVNAIACVQRDGCAVGFDNAPVLLLDQSLRLMRSLGSQLESVARLDWSRRTAELFVGTRSGRWPQRITRLQRWKAGTWELLAQVERPDSDVGAFAVGPTGRELVVGAMSQTSLWNVDEIRPEPDRHEDKVPMRVYSEDLRRFIEHDPVLSASVVRDASSGAQVGRWCDDNPTPPIPMDALRRTLFERDSLARYVVLSPDGSHVCTLNDLVEGFMSILTVDNVSSAASAVTLLANVHVQAVAFGDDSEQLAIVTTPRDRDLKIPPRTRKLLEALAIGGRDALAEGLENDLEQHKTSAADNALNRRMELLDRPGVGRVTVFDTAGMLPIASFVTGYDLVEAIRLSPDGQHIAALGANYPSVWRIADTEKVLEIAPAYDVREVAHMFLDPASVLEGLTDDDVDREFRPKGAVFSLDGSELLVPGTLRAHARFTRRWDLRANTELAPSPCYGRGMRVMPDGRHAVRIEGGGVIVEELESGREIAFWPDNAIGRVAIRDEGRIAALSDGRRLTILELAGT